MFCYKCGYQIAEDALFCSKCGTAQNTTDTKITANSPSDNKELNREAIQIYLSNILTLECAINKLQSDWYVLDEEIRKFESNNYNERFQCSEYRYAWLRYDGDKFYLYFNTDKNGNYYLGLCEELYYSGAWLPIDENWDYLNIKSNWPSNYSSASLIGMFLIEPIITSSQAKTNMDNFFEAYKHFKETAPDKYNKNLQIIKPSIDKREEIQNEMNEAKALLKNAYDINVIPQQFRNIYAMWFIHDYIATSNESLSSAFLHCDLDVIKQKLDTIIDQQEEIIINQAILMAQNAQMVEQNQQRLNRLASVERNTDRAAQYAKFASSNAEACAWISVANYIKK